ncbi:MAG: response regulator [Planctomycetes bacterium]|nr:response regulator [Planctomycetota bacterium]
MSVVLAPHDPLSETDFELSDGGGEARGLSRLIEQWVVLPEEWDELPRELKDAVARPDPHTDLLDRLVQCHLLTKFQADKVREGGAGELVLGHYRLLDLLGRGGMGTVYRAEHLHLRRQVAVKVMARAGEPNPRLLHRFYGEARAVAKLQHPNIVSCLDAGRYAPPGASPRDYYVMELIGGADLHAAVNATGPLPPNRVCDLFRQIAEALAEAHRFGLVHRDIKPSNILITPDWQAKLLDFGLALRPQNRMTEPGLLLGTIGYMAPEQAQASHEVDARADLFSLGATMYWALTGREPFPETGNVLRDLTARLTAPPLDVRKARPELPDELGALVGQLTDRDRDRRYQSARAVAATLAGYARWASVRESAERPAVPRVLVVEDDPRLRRLMVSLLRDCTCTEAGDGKAAWALLEKQPFDLLVLDVNLPEMSGPELLARVRADEKLRERTRTLMVSGDLPSESLGGYLMTGADDYLEKPFLPPAFQARARGLLGRRVAPTPVPVAAPAPSRAAPITKIAPGEPLAFGVTRLLEELGLVLRGYHDRCGRYVRALAAATPDEGEYARLRNPEFVELLVRAAPLHDAGVLLLPSSILMKPTALEPEEQAIAQQHTVMGAQVLADTAGRWPVAVPELNLACEVARAHHERWDGCGYPDCLRGAQIPLSARVVAIIAVYEALRTKRPHRPALTHAQVVRLLTNDSPGEFDPVLMKGFATAARHFDEVFQSGKG